MWRERIITKQYDDLTTYYSDWKTIMNEYFEQVKITNAYEHWAKFAFDKIAEGSLRIAKNSN